MADEQGAGKLRRARIRHVFVPAKAFLTAKDAKEIRSKMSVNITGLESKNAIQLGIFFLCWE